MRFIILFFTLLLVGRISSEPKTHISFSSWGSKSEISVIAPQIKEFEKQNPNIRIDFLHIPQNYLQKLHLLFASNLAPDVILINNSGLLLYADSGHFKDLTPYIDKELYYKASIEALSYKNKIYASPRDISNIVIYYNKDIFKGKTPVINNFNDLKNVCKDVNNKNNWCINFEEGAVYWLPYIYSNGGKILDGGKIVFDSPQNKETIQFYSDLRNKYHFAPTKSEASSLTNAQLFINGKLALLVSGRWFTPIFRKNRDLNWGTIPFMINSKNGSIPADATGYAISSKSKNKEAAIKFVQFLSNKENIEKTSSSGLIIPARKDVEIDSNAFLQAAKNSVARENCINYNKLTDRIKENLEGCFEGSQNCNLSF